MNTIAQETNVTEKERLKRIQKEVGQWGMVIHVVEFGYYTLDDLELMYVLFFYSNGELISHSDVVVEKSDSDDELVTEIIKTALEIRDAFDAANATTFVGEWLLANYSEKDESAH